MTQNTFTPLPYSKEHVMRHVLLSVAVVAVVCLSARTGMADQRYRGGSAYQGYCEHYQYHEYSGYDSRGANYSPARSYGYGHYRPSYRRSSSRYGSRSYLPSSHNAATRRITDYYSRDRYSPHPRSMYKSSPARYGRW